MPDKFPTLLFQLFLLLVLFCSRGYTAVPMIYGVTQGSVYADYVRIYWFEPDGVATLSHNGTSSPYNSGTKIENDGSYIVELSVDKDGQPLSKSVAFQINKGTSPSIANLQTHTNPALTGLTIEFEPNDYSGKPIIVIWTEDMAGNFLQNLYVSTAAATNYMRFTNNLVNRPQAVPYWAHKTCPPMAGEGSSLHIAQPEIPLPDGLDAVSGATQMLGFTLNSHVQAPRNQNQMKVLLEINQSYDDGWYFAAEKPLREETDAPSGATFGDDPYYNGSNEPSLIYSVEVNLDQPGTYTTAEPSGYGHYGGRTGTLYTDFYALNGTTEKHKFDIATLMVDHLSVTVHKLPGDINGDRIVDLLDAIIGLQVCTGNSHPINRNSDLNDNGMIGMEEVMLVLRQNAF